MFNVHPTDSNGLYSVIVSTKHIFLVFTLWVITEVGKIRCDVNVIIHFDRKLNHTLTHDNMGKSDKL